MLRHTPASRQTEPQIERGVIAFAHEPTNVVNQRGLVSIKH
jgi:hypothetical protein